MPRVDKSAVRAHRDFPEPEVSCAGRPSGAIGPLVRLRRALTWLFTRRAAATELQRAQAELHGRYLDLERSQRERRELEARFERAFELSPSAMLITRLEDATVVAANQTWTRMVGVPREKLIGRVSARPWAETGQRDEIYAVLVRDGSVRNFEARFRHPNGEIIVGLVSAQLTKIDGEPCVIWQGVDVTEQKRLDAERALHRQTLEAKVAARTVDLERANRELRALQARLIVAERLGAGEELAAILADSINNPLAALIGNLELQRENGAGDPSVARSLRLAHRIKSVVQQTLRTFRREALDPSLEDPGSILVEVDESIATRADFRGVDVSLKVEPDLPPVHVDRTLLVSALVSIAENGIEAAGDGGVLSLQAVLLEEPGVVQLTIADSGPGVPAELREKVFEPFFSTRRSSTGLGLSIARGVVSGHGGRIWIGGRPGGGTSVMVELPAEQESILTDV